jgi:hypothetical protein
MILSQATETGKPNSIPSTEFKFNITLTIRPQFAAGPKSFPVAPQHGPQRLTHHFLRYPPARALRRPRHCASQRLDTSFQQGTDTA